MKNKPDYDYLAPVWTGDVAYNESFLPLDGVPNPSTGVCEESGVIPLLYPALEILKVTDSSLETIFEPGRDYELRGDKLFLPEGSRIHKMSREEYNPPDKAPNTFSEIGFTCRDGGYLFFAEGPEMHRRQYYVTYRHTGSWNGVIPTPADNLLPRFRQKLAQKAPVKVAFTGDSITTGANSSGMPLINIPPYLPMWPEMICNALTEKYGPAECVNRSKGGMCSNWGVDTAVESFSDVRPDLCIIAYGMNDASGGIPSWTVAENYDRIAAILTEINPECEFVFVSTTLPNPLAPQFYKKHAEHEPLLYALSEKYADRATVAPITSVHSYLMSKKRFFDMTGNNINHPNDYLARVYAQTILSVIGY